MVTSPPCPEPRVPLTIWAPPVMVSRGAEMDSRPASPLALASLNSPLGWSSLVAPNHGNRLRRRPPYRTTAPHTLSAAADLGPPTEHQPPSLHLDAARIAATAHLGISLDQSRIHGQERRGDGQPARIPQLKVLLNSPLAGPLNRRSQSLAAAYVTAPPCPLPRVPLLIWAPPLSVNRPVSMVMLPPSLISNCVAADPSATA